MSLILRDLLPRYPSITLANAQYHEHFNLGKPFNLSMISMQRLQTFVNTKHSPHCFVVVGKLSSFEVIEDAVCRFSYFAYFFVTFFFYSSVSIFLSLSVSFHQTVLISDSCLMSK